MAVVDAPDRLTPMDPGDIQTEPDPRQSTRRKNIASIQYLRFIAASIVVMYHSSIAIEKYYPGALPKIFLNEAVLGAAGVHVFFVISGFIMVRASFRTENSQFVATDFALRRIIRIYPIYFIYSALYLYFYHQIGLGKDLSTVQTVCALLLFPGYSSEIIGPGWTLSYELYFYLCFGLAMRLGLTRGLVALTAFFLVLICIGIVGRSQQPAIHVFTNALLLEFLLGAWIGRAVVKGVRVHFRQADVLTSIAIAAFLAGAVYGFGRLPSVLMWGAPSALLIAGLVFRELDGRLPRFMRKTAFLGDSSYSLYLLHVMLIDAVLLIVIPRLPAGLQPNTTFLGILVTYLGLIVFCILVAFIAYELIEKRIIHGLQRLHRKSLSVPSVMPR